MNACRSLRIFLVLVAGWISPPASVARCVDGPSYGYDKAGNRTHVRIAQKNGGGVLQDNVASFLYGYDGLNRLVSADMGALDSANQAILNNALAPIPLTTDWTLDNLGNWTGDATYAGFTQTGDLDGDGAMDAGAFKVDHITDNANQVNSVGPPNKPELAVEHLYDPVGNLVSDGTYYYQYDAFNRLIQVNELEVGTTFDNVGRIVTGSLKNPTHYIYDGLGRLITKEVSIDGATGGGTRSDYYYDGVRRIEETATTLATNPPPSVLAFEFVYGPDYVDEFVVQFASGRPVYVLQDANYNVVGSYDQIGKFVSRYIYTPYGRVASSEDKSKGATAPIGHQGLFFDRYNGQSPAITAGAKGLYQNRNRSYSPDLGRFVQRDPNETALPIQTALAVNGATFSTIAGAFDIQALYDDGMNLYGYETSSPVNRRDPAGLFALGGLLGGISGRTILVGTGVTVVAGRGLAEGFTAAIRAAINAIQDLYAIIIEDPDALPGRLARGRDSGDCSPAQHAALQAAVEAACKGASSGCRPGMSQAELYANLARNEACAAARDAINRKCFKGGDAGHKEAADTARVARARCLREIRALR